MPDLSAVATLIKMYPAFWAQYKNIPELVQVLAKVADPNNPMTEAQLTNVLWDTTYWKTHSQNARAWDVLAATDPAEAQRNPGARISD